MLKARSRAFTNRSLHSHFLVCKARLFVMLRIFIEDDAGQGTVEYALVISLLSVVAIASLKVLGRKANVTFEQAARHLK